MAGIFGEARGPIQQAGDPAGRAARSTGGVSGLMLWGPVFVLMLIGILNYIDRILPNILLEGIKRDLNLSDTMLGLINGIGFHFVYIVFGLAIARLSDRGNYRLIIGASVFAWSVMTMFGGMAQTGWQLALARMGVAAGEAGSTPAAHAFIARNFPPERRAAPLAVMSMGIPIGIMIGIMGGGFISHLWGWRTAFVVMGGLSLLAAPLVFILPGQSRAKPGSQPPIRTLRGTTILLKKPSVITLIAASTLIAGAGYGGLQFGPAFLMRSHGMSVVSVGMWYGLSLALAGLAGLAVSGILANRLTALDPRWTIWLLIGLPVLALPFSIAAVLVPNGWAALVCIAIAGIPVLASPPLCVAALQRVTTIDMRATVSAVMLFFHGSAGSLAPLLVGMISDGLRPRFGNQSLNAALLVIPVLYAAAIAVYFLSTRYFRAELIEDEPGRLPV
jgi:predicted MFS family arabinose efflux permease